MGSSSSKENDSRVTALEKELKSLQEKNEAYENTQAPKSLCHKLAATKILDSEALKKMEHEGRLFVSEVGSETSKIIPSMQIMQNNHSINEFTLGAGVIFVSLIGAFGGNYLWRCNKTVQRKRMLDYIRQKTGYDFQSTKSAKLSRCPTLPSVVNSTLPVMIMGPTGCGKSTFLKQIAYEYSSDKMLWYHSYALFTPKPTLANRPVFYLSVRNMIERYEKKPSGGHGLTIANTSRAILRTVILPAAAPWIQSLISALSLKTTPSDADVGNDALHNDIKTLFDSMRDIHLERLHAGASSREARPLLIMDEIDELVRTEAASENDSGVFRVLCDKVAEHVVKEQMLHFIVAGSPHSLHQAFDLTTLHWSRYELSDPSSADVMPMLIEMGYSEQSLQACFDVTGTRLGLLMQITPGNEAENLKSVLNTGLFTLRHLFYTLECDSDTDNTNTNTSNMRTDQSLSALSGQRLTLARALDTIVREGAVGPSQTPHSLRQQHSLLCSRVFYERSDGMFCFQNDALRNVWITHRSQILGSL